MATLTIRNLPDVVRDALRVRAARNGRSMEAEVRALIEEKVAVDREDSDLMALPFEERVRRIQRSVREQIGEGRSLVEELLEERRANAKAELE